MISSLPLLFFVSHAQPLPNRPAPAAANFSLNPSKLPKEELSQSNLAYLTDRVLLAEGKKQLYGTQFTVVDGKWKPRPLEDEANVDKRRAEVGLPPLAEYTKLIEQAYGGSKK